MRFAPLQTIETFFLRPASSRPLAVFRILFGTFAIVEMLSLRRHWLALFGNEGIVQWLIGKEIYAVDWIPHLANLATLLKPLGISEAGTVRLAAISYLLALAAMTIGFCTRLSAGIAWALHVVLWNTAPFFGYGVESFTRVGLFYCIFMPIARWYALDRYGRRPAEDDSWGAGLSYRVLQLHLCIVYFTTGIAKIQGQQWRDGEALWRVLGQPDYARFDLLWLAEYPTLLLLGTWMVLFVELGYAFLIWPRITRPLAFFGILALHSGIAVFMGLWGFAAVMILLNLGAWGTWRQDGITRYFGKTASVLQKATQTDAA